MKKTVFLRVAALWLTLFCLLSLAGCGADSGSRYPTPPADFYVYDEAGMLSASTEAYLIERNDALFALSGAQIVVVCVETTGTTDIADYAAGIFNEWGIGSAEENNGILLLLSRAEDDYWMLQGKGLENLLPSGSLKLMIDELLEPDFAVGSYDRGVISLFDAICDSLEEIYSISLDSWEGAAGSYTPGERIEAPPADTSSDLLFWIILIVIVIVLVLIFSGSGGSGGSGGGGGGNRRSRVTYSPFIYTPRPTYRPTPPRPPSRPSGYPGSSRPSSRPGGYTGGPRPTSRPGGYSGGSRPSSRPSGGRSGGGGFSRGGGVGRR